VDVTDPSSEETGARWWEAITGRGAEGMVVKPLDFLVRSRGRLVQPALKCRGREYLRIIYGPEYTLPENLERLRERSLGAKRAVARLPGGPALHALGAAVGAAPARRGGRARLRGGARGDRHPGAARARLLPAQPGGAGRIAARALGARADRRARALRAPRHPVPGRPPGRALRRGRGRGPPHSGALARRGAGGLPRLHRHHRAREHGRTGNADRLALRAARAAVRRDARGRAAA